MKNSNFPNISTILLATLVILLGGLCAPLLHKYYTYKPLELIETDQDWTITLTSPNADEYETWYYHGKKPVHVYTPSGSYVAQSVYHNPLKTDNGEPRAPIGWYLYITNGKEDETIKTIKNQ